MCVLIDVFVLLCSFVIICLLYIFVVVVFFFVADTLYRLCLLCMPSIVVNLTIIIIIIQGDLFVAELYMMVSL